MPKFSYPAARKTISIVQSNYIPWKGYFDLIDRSDEFVILDDVQYTKNDWRNRNKIKTPNGVQWITIPVKARGRFGQKICEVEVSNKDWARKHWKTICQNYSSAPYFDFYKGIFEQIYHKSNEILLSKINHRLITTVIKILGVSTRITWSSDYDGYSGDPTERVVRICESAGASVYLSGPAAKGYINQTLFDRAGIELRFIDYSGYPQYAQLYPPFEHAVTILDLIFSVGPEAIRYIRREDAELLSSPSTSTTFPST